ncbi:MAG: FAD:protein FMN transferase [bacterium]|nr:FAD:protein FMN transferase [bacterium]
MKRRDFIQLTAASCLSAVAHSIIPFEANASNGGVPPQEITRRAIPFIGSYLEITITKSLTSEPVDNIITACFSKLKSSANEMNYFSSGNLLDQLNKERVLPLGSLPYPLRETLIAAECAQNTDIDGFSILCGGLTNLWRRARKQETLPPERLLKEALTDTQNSRIHISRELVLLEGKGTLDLGGIGKGALCDQAAKFLAKNGVTEGCVDCGGDMQFIGNTPQLVGIADPDCPTRIAAKVYVPPGGAIATSGIGETKWHGGGRDMHHLLSLSTGYPSSRFKSASIVAPTALTADMLATVACVSPSRHLNGFFHSSSGKLVHYQ